MNQEMIRYLVQKGKEWITNQRNHYYPTAEQLLEKDRTSLISFFDSPILNIARLSYVDHIENPPFYGELRQLGILNLVDFTRMAGITFNDCILISRRFSLSQQSWTSLLFHEMVHVVQYNLLGVQRFAELYVIGWAQNGFIYENIPLERQAYNLQRQFEQGGLPFSVVQHLSQQFGHVG